MKVTGQVKTQTVKATIVRADGTIEYLGVISRYTIPWYKRLWYSFQSKDKK